MDSNTMQIFTRVDAEDLTNMMRTKGWIPHSNNIDHVAILPAYPAISIRTSPGTPFTSVACVYKHPAKTNTQAIDEFLDTHVLRGVSQSRYTPHVRTSEKVTLLINGTCTVHNSGDAAIVANDIVYVGLPTMTQNYDIAQGNRSHVFATIAEREFTKNGAVMDFFDVIRKLDKAGVDGRSDRAATFRNNFRLGVAMTSASPGETFQIFVHVKQ